METFIVVVSLVFAATGGLILLTSLAGKRAELVKAFNINQELESDQTFEGDESLSNGEDSKNTEDI